MARPTSVRRMDDSLAKLLKEVASEYEVSEVAASRIVAKEFRKKKNGEPSPFLF